MRLLKTLANRSVPAQSLAIDRLSLSYALISGLLAVFLNLALMAPAMADTPSPTADPAVYAGHDLYKKKCYVCHDVRKERTTRCAKNICVVCIASNVVPPT